MLTCAKSNQVEVDGYLFTEDRKTGYYLSTKPINGKRIRLHRYLWIKHNGEIPEGYDIHHLDGDRKNNDIPNLTIMPRVKHKAKHFRDAALDPKKLALWPTVRQKGSDSHKLPEMREKQSKRSKDQWEERKADGPKSYTCKECGDSFESHSTFEPMFCSRKCKARDFRRRFKEKHGYGYDQKIRPNRDRSGQGKKR